MPITTQELGALETRINAKVAGHRIAFSLSVHFSFDRVNHPRNRPPITLAELEDIFDRLNAKHMQTLWALGDGDTYNIRCTQSHINIPCVIEKQLSNGGVREYLHSTITVMRNPHFVAYPGAVDLKV
jgi:hypothetical protein